MSQSETNKFVPWEENVCCALYGWGHDEACGVFSSTANGLISLRSIPS